MTNMLLFDFIVMEIIPEFPKAHNNIFKLQKQQIMTSKTLSSKCFKFLLEKLF